MQLSVVAFTILRTIIVNLNLNALLLYFMKKILDTNESL